MAEITVLLERAGAGDKAALDELMPLVYPRLRELARRQIGAAESHPRTLDTTALVHELYLSLHRGEGVPSAARGAFFAYAATAMRHILVDAARRRLADKRGGGARHVALEDAVLSVDAQAHDVLAVDQALQRLQALEPRLARVVELRFFAGLGVEDAALALGRDPRSVVRDWQKARLFLHRALADG